MAPRMLGCAAAVSRRLLHRVSGRSIRNSSSDRRQQCPRQLRYERDMVEHVRCRSVHKALELYSQMKREQIPLSKRICNNMLSLQPADPEPTLQMARLCDTVLEDMAAAGLEPQESTLSNAIRLQVQDEGEGFRVRVSTAGSRRKYRESGGAP